MARQPIARQPHEDVFFKFNPLTTSFSNCILQSTLFSNCYVSKKNKNKHTKNNKKGRESLEWIVKACNISSIMEFFWHLHLQNVTAIINSCCCELSGRYHHCCLLLMSLLPLAVALFVVAYRCRCFQSSSLYPLLPLSGRFYLCRLCLSPSASQSHNHLAYKLCISTLKYWPRGCGVQNRQNQSLPSRIIGNVKGRK